MIRKIEFISSLYRQGMIFYERGTEFFPNHQILLRIGIKVSFLSDQTLEARSLSEKVKSFSFFLRFFWFGNTFFFIYASLSIFFPKMFIDNNNQSGDEQLNLENGSFVNSDDFDATDLWF